MIKQIFRISFGVLLIIIGIAGIFLPVVPGLLLILAGCALAADKNPKVLFGEIIAKIKKRHGEKCA